MKKIISILITVAMLVTLLAGMTLSTSATTYSGTWGELTWSFDANSGELIISGEGAMNDFTSGSSNAWRTYSNLIKTVVINEGVTSIGDYAFPAFMFTSIDFPDSVTSIGSYAFRNCSKLTSVNIGDNVTNIEDYAFRNCSRLATVTIGSGVTNIGDDAFRNCNALTAITVDENNLYYKSIDGNLYSKDGKTLILYTIGKTANSFTVPNGVTSIERFAFHYASFLTNVTIPDTVTSIGNSAFYNCSVLRTVNIPDAVTSIGNSAFYACTSLTGVNIPEGVTSISNSLFYECNSLKNVTIPDSVTSIGDTAFFNCTALTDINIPEAVTSVGNEAFFGCSGLTSIKIPENVTSIGFGAFCRCSNLKSITIPDGVTLIDDTTFADCTALTSINIPESITRIGWCAFDNCANLANVNYYGTETKWNKITIDSDNDPLLNATINYIYGSETFNSASVRISADHPGIRFKTAIEQSVLDELIAQYGKENIKIGTIIIPEDMVTELDMVTIAALDAAGINYVKVLANIDNPFAKDGTTNIYAGSLVNIKEANLDRDFIGVGYIEITKGDGEVIHYYSSTTAKRNISYVATCALEDTSETQVDEYKYEIVVGEKVCYSPYPEAQREILGKLIVKK